MDPDENLREQREIIERLRQPTDDSDQAWSDVDRLCELSQALDEWISKAGYLPAPWGKHWRGVRS